MLSSLNLLYLGILGTCLGVVAYAYVGYPVLLSMLARRHGIAQNRAGAPPLVTLVIPMHNEAAVILKKIENTAALDYPASCLEVMVVDDGSSDGSAQLASDCLPKSWRLITNQLRAGKPSIVNQAVDLARGDIVMLSDADTLLPPHGLRAMIDHFADPAVGAVTGEVRMADRDGPGAAEESYWRYENGLKEKQSRLGMVMGGSGGTVAFRRELYTPLEPDCLVDEYLILVRIALAGHLVRAEPRAAAVHAATPTVRTEFERRARIVCGGWQSIVRTRMEAMNAPAAARFHYVSHRVLRWAVAPYLLAIALALTIGLAPHVSLARLLLVPAMGSLVVAGLGALAVAARWRVPAILLLPFMLVFLNLAAIAGLMRYLSRSQPVRWARPGRRRAPRGHLDIEVQDRGEELRVFIAGDLRRGGAGQLTKVWPELYGRRRSVWMDFAGVGRWDLRGLSAFVTLLGQAHDARVELRVSGIPVEAVNAANLAGLSPEIIVRDEEGQRIAASSANSGRNSARAQAGR